MGRKALVAYSRNQDESERLEGVGSRLGYNSVLENIPRWVAEETRW